MKKNIFVRMFGVLVIVFNITSILPELKLQDHNIRKKLVIFSSKGGGGHISVSNALKSYLGHKFDVEVVNIFEVLNLLDPVKNLSRGMLDCEDFYNFCLQRRLLSILNMYSYMGSWGIRMRYSAIQVILEDFCKEKKPDLIISVTPFINGSLLDIAQSINVPFIIVTNDLDTTHYAYNIRNPLYSHFYYTLAFNDVKMNEKINSIGMKDTQIKYVGFPLRSEFFTQKNKKAIKKEFNVPNNKPITMVFTGANGSIASYRYVRILSSLSEPVHIIACAGRNKKLKHDLENMKLPQHISLTVVGYTNRIADLMAISDWLFTKSGSNSVVEAMTLNLPMIIDHTSGILWWENLNAEFIRRYGFGGVLYHYKQLKPMVKKIMKSVNRKRMIDRMQRLNKRNFEKQINQLVDFALSQAQ